MNRQASGPVAATPRHHLFNLTLRRTVIVLLAAGVLGALPVHAQENPANPDPDAPTVVLVTGVR